MSVQKLKPKSQFLILYASETGQAKAISEEIFDKAVEYGLKPDCFCMSLTDKRFSIEKENCVVFIVSTTGNGQPPETAGKFYRRLSRNTLKSTHLEHLNYTLLALGDSNYLKFAAFGRQLEHRLTALSAKSFYPTGYGDDAFGIETGVDPWIDNLWPALHKQLGLDFQKNSLIDTYSLSNREIYTLSNMNTSSESEKNNLEEKGNCLATLPSILKEINIENCHVPKVPSPLYTVVYNKLSESNLNFVANKNTLVLPASSLVKASLISAKTLTVGDDVKDTMELTFKFEEEILEYDPGDSFGFICANENEEVHMLLNRLELLDIADIPASLILHEECTTKKKIPAHIPALFSIRELFLYCIEIRAVPKKILLRILSEYTNDEEEKLCLRFLSSQEGSDYFTDFIRKPSLSIIDILLHFKSCKPPVEKIIEYLPSLRPRFYSIASSSSLKKDTFKIVFNVVKIQRGDGRLYDREGVCTGWFKRLSSHTLSSSSPNLTDKLSALNLENKSIFVYKRKNQLFRFPDDLKTTVIMVGPGTGIAPFIGYLQNREQLLQAKGEENNKGETWLFYGCRYQERDYLYREELERLMQNKVLDHLIVSFSRDKSLPESRPRYVYENIRLHTQNISDCIKSGGKIYVCGDAKNMVHDVQQAFIEVVEIGFGISGSESKQVIEKLQKEQRYVNDVWA